MKHKFMVEIEGDFGRKEAQNLLKDIGGFQGTLPPEEQLQFTVRATPITNSPTLIFTRS